MANVKITIPLAGATATIPGAISDNYIIEDSGVMLANYVLTATTPVSSNRVITVWYKGNLDITTNNTDIFLFGHNIPQENLNIDGIFTFSWNGATWDMLYTPDFENTGFISPSKLTNSQRVRTITQIINYDTTVSPMSYSLINPYNNSVLTAIYIKELEFLDNTANIEIDHGLGGFFPFIIYNTADNGVTILGSDKLNIPTGMAAASYSTIIPNGASYISSNPFWQIILTGAATVGQLELTFVFQLQD